MTPGRALQPILQLALSALLSATTLVFGAMPLLWLRRSTHGFVYLTWCVMTALLGIQLTGFDLWIPFLLNAALVYFYVLFEPLWPELVTTASFSVLLTGALSFFSLTAWLEFQGLSISTVIRARAEEFAAQVTALQPAVKINVDSLLPQIPGAFLILLALSLWIALLAESPWQAPLKAKSPLRLTRLQGFRVPDAFIWIFLMSVMLALADLNLPAAQKIAVNVLYVSVILYFFQGVAVIGAFFRWQRMGQFWQILSYVIFITQLFLAVSFLGLLDFWLDFRQRMVKKSAQRMGEVEQ
jgi:hypothetical protein